MSNLSTQNSINRIQKELNELDKKIAQESKKEFDNSLKISKTQQTLSRTKSNSFQNSKLSEIKRYEQEVLKAKNKQTEFQKKIIEKKKHLIQYQQKLLREKETENKKQLVLQKALEKQRQNEHKELIVQLKTYLPDTSSPGFSTTAASNEVFDLFISHASEDKEEFVKPLVIALENKGLTVWYDELTLKIGDKLRRSIDNGLRRSTFGVVILSNSFVKKNWTQYEFDSLVAQEMTDGNKRILPIWHKISKDEVVNFSPNLIDIVALDSTKYTIQEIADLLALTITDKK